MSSCTVLQVWAFKPFFLRLGQVGLRYVFFLVRVGRRDAGVPGDGDGADEAADGDGADGGLDVDVVDVGCLLPDETSPARDFSSSVLDRGGKRGGTAIGGAIGR